MPIRLLIIDDDETGCRLVREILKTENHESMACHTAQSGLTQFERGSFDGVILDLKLPDMDGMRVLEKLRAKDPTCPVILLTASADVKSAVRATQLGAFDYLTKPIDPDDFLFVVRRAAETRALHAQVADLRRQASKAETLAKQMGSSPQMRAVFQQVATVAASDFSVLILGETGAGKELIAQAIHRESARRERPFIAIDCGAIPETLLESELFGHEMGAFTGAGRKKRGHFHMAEGGTVFLDEIGNLPLPLQSKLLRVLESRQLRSLGATQATPLDVRFIAATNDDLPAKVVQQLFRSDLYFRLAQYTIAIPPLRERRGDIAHLADKFLEETRLELRRPVQQISPAVLELLERHDWPGNARELKNVVRRAVLESKDLVISKDAVKKLLAHGENAAPQTPSGPQGKTLRKIAENAAREAEFSAITEALRAHQGNKTRAAKALGTDFKTLHLKMKGLGLRAKDFAP